jgi:hypothetical protein
MKNVKSWSIALEQGCQPREYPFSNDAVPLGVILAVLDFKIWAKKTMGIGCYFSEEKTGRKFQLTVYRDKSDHRYRIKDCPLDFACCPAGPGYLYRLEVQLNGKGNVTLYGAQLLGGTSSVAVENAVG